MIQTSTYTLTSKTFFKILVENRLRRFWWLYLLMISFSTASFDRFGDDKFITAYILLSAVYLPGTVLYLYYWASSKKNGNLYTPHFLTVDEHKVTAVSEGIIQNEVPLKFILKAIERKNYWLLYIAKYRFLYIPKSAFSTAEDQAQFKELIMITKNK